MKCPHCGKELNPAQMLASRPRKRSPEAIEQSRIAASKPRPNAKGKKKPRKISDSPAEDDKTK